MYKTLFVLLAILVSAPFFVSADSYDGPYCFEDPTQFSDDSAPYTQSISIRGTCKSVEMTSIVSLDTSLQNDYLLAQHAPLDLVCERGCETTKYSEIIQPTTTALVFTNEDVAREYKFHDYSSGELKSRLVYPDTAVLLDKKYVLDYITFVYKQAGVKLDNNNFPKIVLMDRNEMKRVEGAGYSYNDLLSLFNDKNDPLYASIGKGIRSIVGDKDASIYTFNYLDFGKHIYSLKGSLAESHYLDFDKIKLPPQDIKVVSAGRAGIKYVVPVTSPIKSVKNYWIFTKKEGKIVLVWQKSEYGLDNGKVNVVSNDNIKINDSSSDNSTNSATSPADNDVPAPLPAEQEKGFFSRLFEIISSWFR